MVGRWTSCSEVAYHNNCNKVQVGDSLRVVVDVSQQIRECRSSYSEVKYREEVDSKVWDVA